MQYLLFSLELSLTFEVVREGKNLTRVNPILPWGGHIVPALTLTNYIF